MAAQQQQGAPLVVVAIGTKLVGMNAQTGQRVWEVAAECDRLHVEDQRVFALAINELLCLDLWAGTLLWKSKLPIGGHRASLLVHGGLVVVGGAGEVVGFAADTGKLLWHDPFKGYGVGMVGLAAPGASAHIDRIN
jgi:outer membrane protein assembly factor BamB